jgi:microcompartment protein CcmK/EutM
LQLARVVGTLVATQKHRKLHAAKLLLVQPVTPQGLDRGPMLLAVDSVGAGIGERVLVVIEGKAAGQALGRKAAPVDAAIVGIVDEVELHESAEAARLPEVPGVEKRPGAAASGTADHRRS